MIFPKATIGSLLFAVVGSASLASAESCTSVESITCQPITSSPPTLDGNLVDWTDVESFETPLTGAITSKLYEHGQVKVQCVYDADRVYFAFEVPGPYRFDTEDNHLCASISTMFRMGEKATLFNMGGCPLAEAQDCDSAPEGCEPYKVDIGGHWELKTTEMGVNYPTNVVDGTGNDLVANKDDEYAVGNFCRFDDDDVNAGNEWAGAWMHTAPSDPTIADEAVFESAANGDGSYIFEMSRLLKTASTETDAQLEGGKAVDFGFAYWDPYETEETGWSKAGHYVTGCSRNWISLKLVDENGEVSDNEDASAAIAKSSPVLAISALVSMFAVMYTAM